MLLDTLNEYSDSQAITATADSTNIVDHGAVENQPVGTELYLHVKITESFNTLTSLDISLQSAATVALVGSAPVVIYTKNILLAGLTAGTEAVRVRVPAGLSRYSQIAYAVNGTDPTTGEIDAFLTPSVDEQGAITA
jgi:hypothetical protein